MSRANKPDTEADIEIRACLQQNPPRSFIVKAGAGSGKTTSLIKALSSVIELHGQRMKMARQRAACITYTEVAASEIWRDIGSHESIHVSTIHSFMWLLAKPFQRDIHAWVCRRINEKIGEIEAKQASYRPGVRQTTKDRDTRELSRLRRQAALMGSVNSFRYGTGSRYTKGILGHDDVIKLGIHLISERPLFRSLIAKQFPFIFVDESQDTTPEVVSSLKLINQTQGSELCLGFFGDPMQRIYMGGAGVIASEDGWAEVSKPENFRCSPKVLSVANAIRTQVDDLTQTPGQRASEPTKAGSAHLFVLPADHTRDENLIRVRNWMASHTGDDRWRGSDAGGFKLLVIVHQMAARRLGFGDLYAALNSKAPSSFKEGFLDGSAWPLSPCFKFLVPLAVAYTEGRQLEVMNLVRAYSPLLDRGVVSQTDVACRLRAIRTLVDSISSAICGDGGQTVRELLTQANEQGLLILDQRLASYIDPDSPTPASDGSPEDPTEEPEDEDEGEKEAAAMAAFLDCPAKQLLPYRNYILEKSPFATQQGIKGAEFSNVLVVLDDAESSHFQFSYEKYLGLKALSDTDQRHMDAGEENIVDRTRRLFYVSCTRALDNLAVVLFTPDPTSAAAHIGTLGIFEDDAIHTESAFRM